MVGLILAALDTPAPSESQQHDYLSTACLHGLHDRCRLTCKFCDVRCRCSCHSAPAPSEPEEG